MRRLRLEPLCGLVDVLWLYASRFVAAAHLVGEPSLILSGLFEFAITFVFDDFIILLALLVVPDDYTLLTVLQCNEALVLICSSRDVSFFVGQRDARPLSLHLLLLLLLLEHKEVICLVVLKFGLLVNVVDNIGLFRHLHFVVIDLVNLVLSSGHFLLPETADVNDLRLSWHRLLHLCLNAE